MPEVEGRDQGAVENGGQRGRMEESEVEINLKVVWRRESGKSNTGIHWETGVGKKNGTREPRIDVEADAEESEG
jgi:hypothetical protein